jgi:hypothetical protein
LKWSIKLNIIFIVLALPPKQCLNIKTHAVHNIHRLAWGPYVRAAPGDCPACPCVKTARATGLLFSLGTLESSTDITEIFLKVALNTIKLTLHSNQMTYRLISFSVKIKKKSTKNRDHTVFESSLLQFQVTWAF